MAHVVEVGTTDERVDDALKTMFEKEYFPPTSRRHRATLLRQAFAYAIAGIHGHASGFTLAVKPLRTGEA
jgi:hypothetical protein